MNKLSILLIFFPVALVLKFFGLGDTWVFLAAALAIIPLAALMGEATENLAAHSGPQLGGFLNATFGNATELIIAIIALVGGHTEIVKASIAGSIIGNLLLVLGASMFAGGLKYKIQSFNKKSAANSSTLLLFAVIALAVPSVFFHNEQGHAPSAEAEGLSLAIAGLMLVIYVLALLFSFKTHRDILGVDHAEHIDVKWTKGKSIAILLGTTVAIGIMSEALVGSVEGLSHTLGWNELFLGIIVVALIGNAAEHSTAITMALKNKMDVSLEITLGSSLQIALFVAPVLVFVSLAVGHPMSLIFNDFELLAMGAAVIIGNTVWQDGESHWLEGIQLLAVYAALGCAFYFLK